ncbi:MAG TPA: zinc-dependent alcohol dehydrogenase family protein [Solirubrobacteraceae bacterium]|jgi:propanol-preferring alcohol dehydrogenase|nr:zinc-dependent alcohol dehydrogenase family protein [Solirubrobacteraceae bacterium]
MRAMVFEAVGQPLRAVELPVPRPAPGQLRVRVQACGVCRTDLHLLDGEVEIASPPRVLGHQIVGVVEASGRAGASEDTDGQAGRRVGIPWLGWTCGECAYCLSGRENLCPNARFTGRDLDGGMAEYALADERYCFPIPDGHPSEQAAPLLCAGLIGYRALRMCGEGERIGLYGFGAAAHILTQICRWEGRRVFAFTRAGDDAAQSFALELGATWAGDSEQRPPGQLDAAIVFAPVGALVPLALRAVAPGGTVVCGGIHMSEIPAFPYSILWEERVLRSVANLTREDAVRLLELAPRAGVGTHVTTYPLAAANEALADLRAGRFVGAAVLIP